MVVRRGTIEVTVTERVDIPGSETVNINALPEVSKGRRIVPRIGRADYNGSGVAIACVKETAVQFRIVEILGSVACCFNYNPSQG